MEPKLLSQDFEIYRIVFSIMSGNLLHSCTLYHSAIYSLSLLFFESFVPPEIMHMIDDLRHAVC